MNRQLRVVAFNCNGLLSRAVEIETFVLNEKIDILLLNETHLLPQRHFRIRGYNFYRADSPNNNSWGGSGVLIRSNISHYPDESRSVISQIFQSVGVTVPTSNGEIYFASVYSPSSAGVISEAGYNELFTKLGPRFIIGGDWNAKHIDYGSRVTNTRGRNLIASARAHDCDFFSDGKPTIWPSDPAKKPDLIDFFVSKNVSKNYVQVGSYFGKNESQDGDDDDSDLFSDHSAIILVLDEQVVLREGPAHLTNTQTDWDKFRRILHDSLGPNPIIVNRSELDLAVKNFTEAVRNAAMLSTPARKIVEQDFKLPPEILDAIRERRRLRNRWKRSRFPGDRAAFNKASRHLSALLQQLKQDRLESFLKSLSPGKATDYSLWKSIRYLKRSIVQSPPIRTSEGGWAKSAAEKAKVFSLFLTDAFSPNSEAKWPEDRIDIQREMSRTQQGGPVPMDPIRKSEIEYLIKYKTKNKKAPGMDGITGEILKQLPDRATKQLEIIYNAVLTLRYFPADWKRAEVIVLPKAGKPPGEASSYRPISLLSTLGKLFERCYLKRLNTVVAERKILPDHQFGFRAKHSTIEQVHRVTDTIEGSLEEGNYCVSVFLDVSQAFDKIWHPGLLLKLYRVLPQNHYELLVSYLEERSFRVRYEGAFSDFAPIRAGVPQGSVLGPALFILFMHDIPETEGVLLSIFADDTALTSKGKTLKQATDRLQVGVNGVAGWFRRWRSALNSLKSQHCVFAYRRVPRLIPPVWLDGKPVPQSKTAKYLGMTLDTQLRWKSHVKLKRKEMMLKYNRMRWLLGPRSQLSLDNKILLYKQVLRPILSYGCQLWGCTARSNLATVQRAQNIVLRRMTGAPWFVRNSDISEDLGICDLSTMIRDTAIRYEQRLLSHPNSEALKLLDNSGELRRLRRRQPFELVSDFF